MSCLSKHFHQSAVASIYPWSSHDPLTHSSRITALTTRRRVITFLVFYLIVSFLLFPARSTAEEARPQSSTGLGIGLGGIAVYRFPAKVDGGGNLSTTSLIFNANLTNQVNEKLRLGVGFSYEFTDYDFSGLTNFSVARPWQEVQRLGFSLPIIYTLADQWRLLITPTAQFSGEFGANWGDAMIYGGAIAVTYAVRPDAVFGLGVAGYADIEEAMVFPYFIVKWQITDRLQLTNPYRTSPAGPAGLELSYAMTKEWTAGIGGSYRSQRFRLDSNGPLPNGIGAYKTIPIFVRLSYKPVPAFGIDLYSGVSFLNKLYVQNPEGDDLYETKHRPAPLVGVGLSGTF